MNSQMIVSIRDEVTHFTDSDTGVRMIQWTDSPAKDQHLYFTSPSVTADGQWLVIISERNGGPDLYALHRADKTLRKLTQAGRLLRSYTYPTGGATGLSKASPFLDAARKAVYWVQDDVVWRSGLEAGEGALRLAELPKGWVGGYSHLSADGSQFCIACTDPRAFSGNDRNQHDQLRSTPWRMLRRGLKCAVLVICTRTGVILRRMEVPFWVTHVQFDPQDPDRILCNSEGGVGSSAIRKFPYWGRIWILEQDGSWRRFVEQPQWRFFNHENWSPDGTLVFYHGKEASGEFARWKARLDALIGRLGLRLKKHVDRSQSHFVEAVDRSGQTVFTLPIPNPVSHAIATCHGADFVMDSRNGFIYRGLSSSKTDYVIQRLCRHGSSMFEQDSHPHPVWTTRQSGIVFTSDVAGSCNVYEAGVAV